MADPNCPVGRERGNHPPGTTGCTCAPPEEPALDRQHRLILERRKRIRGQLAEHDARARSEPTRDFGMLGHALREQVFWLDSLDVLFTHAKTQR